MLHGRVTDRATSCSALHGPVGQELDDLDRLKVEKRQYLTVRGSQLSVAATAAIYVFLALAYQLSAQVVMTEGSTVATHWISPGPYGDSIFVAATYFNKGSVRTAPGLRWRLSAIYRPSSGSRARHDSLKVALDEAGRQGLEVLFNDGGAYWWEPDGKGHRLPRLPYSLVAPRDRDGRLRPAYPKQFIRNAGPGAAISDTIVFHVRPVEYDPWPGTAEVTCYLEAEGFGEGAALPVLADTLRVSVPLPLGHRSSR